MLELLSSSVRVLTWCDHFVLSICTGKSLNEMLLCKGKMRSVFQMLGHVKLKLEKSCGCH